MTGLIDAITSPSLANHARRSFGLSVDGLVSIYLHQSGGRVSIGGGSYGAQWIDSLAIDSDLVDWIRDLVRDLDSIIDLDFQFVDGRASSNLDVYIDTEISIGSSGQVLGLAIPNSSRLRSWWEVIINGPKILADPDYLRFAIAHELGHTIGLEHPWDPADGDSTGSVFADPAADETVMSYTRPVGGWPSFWRPADLTALVGLWGLEDDQGSRDWLLQTASDDVIKLDTQSALDRLALGGGDLLLGLAPEGWSFNAAPRGGLDRFELPEDGALTLRFADLIANDQDPEGAPLRVVAVAGVDVVDLPFDVQLEGALVSVDPQLGLRLVPELDFHGLVSTLYTVSDGEMRADVPLEFVVASENDPPALRFALNDLPVSLGERFATRLPLDAFFDVDGDVLSFAAFVKAGTDLMPLPDWLSFDSRGGWLTGAAPLDVEVADLQLVVVASDPSGSTASAPMLLQLNPPVVSLLPSPIETPAVQPPPAAQSLPAAPPSGSAGAASVPVSSSVLPVAAPPESPLEATAPSETRASVVTLLAASVDPVAPGSIGFGPDHSARLVAQRNTGDSLLPSVLAGGLASDRYSVSMGGFSVIADSPVADPQQPNRDTVTGLKGDPSSWSAQRVGEQDWLISRTAPTQGETFVLLADPLGRLNPSHRLETLQFKQGPRSSRRLSVKQALRQFKPLDPIAYDQLPGPVRQGLEAVVGDLGGVSSLHAVIAPLHPSALI